MNKKRSFLASLMVVIMVVAMIPSVAFAATVSSADFVDMPNDWSTDALEKAVSNGLISGFDETGGKYIKPASFLTRAQMATIVNRAFGAENQSYLSGVQDVPSGEWFAKDMAKAVGMGTFMLSSSMRPNDPITRQEAFTVLARAFKLTDKDNSASLYRFTDGVNVASFAKASVCAMIDAKYVAGSDGYLYPTSNISRAEFAKVMDNLVKQYCDTSGETFTVSSITGNVMINEPGVTIKNTIIRGDLIVGDGVGSGNVILDNVDVTGRTIIRGGGLNSIRIKSTCDIPNITIAKIEGNVRVLVDSGGIVDVVNIIDGDDDVVLEGEFGTVTINKSLPVYFNGATINIVQVNETTTMTMDEDTEIDRITVDSDAVGTKVINNGLITKLVSSIKVTVSGSGTVTENLATGGTLTLTSIASIIGTAKFSSELEAGVLKPSGATATYQWMSASSSNGTYTKISGATSKTYTPVVADLGRYLKVTATGKTSYTGSVTSVATAAVAATKITATTITGVIVPAAGASPDTSVDTTSEYTATIVWTGNPSTFETGVSYTATIRLTPKTGYTLTGVTANQFKVAGASATNPVDSGTITAVFPVIGAIVNAVAPVITNNLTDRTTTVDTPITLNATATVTDGGTLSYKWYSATAADKTGATALAGATSATYAPAVAATGTFYYYCIVTNTNGTATGTKTADTISAVSTVSVTVAAQATPSFSPESGAIAFGTTVTITSAGADAIYYTTDGSDPSIASTNQATTPLVINAAGTIKAIAVKAGKANSSVGSATYTQAMATAPSSAMLVAGGMSPVGGVINVAMPAAGGNDSTGAVTGWAAGSADRIKLTVTDSSPATSTITINGSEYVSGADYQIAALGQLTIAVKTTETGKVDAIRVFLVSVTAL